MKSFSREEIDKWRKTFTERKYPQEEKSIDRRIVRYFIMPRDLFQGIPNGLFRMTGEPKEGYIVGVSDEVPVEIQPHFALSEHDEFMIFGLDDPERTLHSERNMLSILRSSPLKNLYTANKLILYDYMLRNSKGNLDKWGFTKQDYIGFEKASKYLRNSHISALR